MDFISVPPAKHISHHHKVYRNGYAINRNGGKRTTYAKTKKYIEKTNLQQIVYYMCTAKAQSVLYGCLLAKRKAGGKNIVEDKTDDISRSICHIYIDAQLQHVIYSIVYSRG